MSHQSALTVEIKPCEWSEEIAAYIQSAITVPVEVIRAQLEKGAALFAVFFSGALSGAYVLRLDETVAGIEGVIVAAGGDFVGVDWIAAVLPIMEQQLIEAGASRLRIHTARPGMARRLCSFGYGAQEIVLSKGAQ